jgi:hypothetical protein
MSLDLRDGIERIAEGVANTTANVRDSVVEQADDVRDSITSGLATALAIVFYIFGGLIAAILLYGIFVGWSKGNCCSPRQFCCCWRQPRAPLPPPKPFPGCCIQ